MSLDSLFIKLIARDVGTQVKATLLIRRRLTVNHHWHVAVHVLRQDADGLTSKAVWLCALPPSACAQFDILFSLTRLGLG